MQILAQNNGVGYQLVAGSGSSPVLQSFNNGTYTNQYKFLTTIDAKITHASWATKCEGDFGAIGFVQIGHNFVNVAITGTTGALNMRAMAHPSGQSVQYTTSSSMANPVFNVTLGSQIWQFFYNGTSKRLKVETTNSSTDHIAIFSFF